jgi:protein-tyrosine-phosphatase
MAAAILRHLAGPHIYATSRGVRAGQTDPLAIAVMNQRHINIEGNFRSRSGLSYQCIPDT